MANVPTFVTSPIVNISCVSYDTLARRAWKKYRALVRNKYPDLGEVSAKYFTERVDAPSIIPLNAHLPALLAQPFNVTDSAIIQEIIIAHLHLDHFVQLIDDASDVHDHASPHALHLSHQLLNNGITRYIQVSNNPEKLSHRIAECIDQMLWAERAVWRHHGVFFPYTEEDYTLVARRGSLIYCAVALYADVSSNWKPLDTLEQGLGSLVLGVQLIDDLLDWRDDLSQRIYTSLIVSACQYEKIDISYADEVAVARAIIRSGAADAILEHARKEFNKAKNDFGKVGAFLLGQLVDRLNDNIMFLSRAVSELRRDVHAINDAGRFTRMIKTAADSRMSH